MIYFTTAGGTGAVLVIEPGNLERLLRGEPIRSPDGNLLICYAPDMPWFEKEFKAMVAARGGEIDGGDFDMLMRMGKHRPRVDR